MTTPTCHSERSEESPQEGLHYRSVRLIPVPGEILRRCALQNDNPGLIRNLAVDLDVLKAGIMPRLQAAKEDGYAYNRLVTLDDTVSGTVSGDDYALGGRLARDQPTDASRLGIPPV